MLELRTNSELCDCDLPFDSRGAMICTFECTFCRNCVDTKSGGTCPDCGGNFEARPIRPSALLDKYPPSNNRVTGER